MAARSFFIPPETAQCPICGPDPEFIVIEAQAIGCTDPDDVHAFRPGEDCPVLPIEASKLCILEQAALRAAVDKVLRGCKALTEPQERVLRTWHQLSIFAGQPSPAAAAALLLFRFFPLEPSSGQQGLAPPATGTGLNEDGDVDSGSSTDPDETFTSRQARKKFDEGRTLEDAVKEDADGSLVLGGAGKAPQPVQETWQDRTGVCAPSFSHYSRDDDGVWVCILPFLQAILAETPTGMLQAHDEKAVGLFADALRFKGREYWRSVTKAVDGVGFITSFIGLLGDELDADALFRVSVGVLLRQAVDVEDFVDHEFERLASKRKSDRGWGNKDYCDSWGGSPTAALFAQWKARQEAYQAADVDDPLVSFESVGGALSIVLERFPTLPKAIFYDVACKIDKNAMRRVRPILRKQGVRCILDRPHSITHSCSPVYMPDQSLGTTAGVATQAAEVSHSVSVGNRTSLAYMAPATYMIHRMIQVAFMNTRKLRLWSARMGYDYDCCKRWGTKLGLSVGDVDLIIVPINLKSVHWVLAVIDIEKRTFHYCDSFLSSDPIDAIGTTRRWLKDEVQQQLGSDALDEMDIDGWQVLQNDGVPEQTDGGSCGVFSLLLADCLSLGLPATFGQRDMPVLRLRLAVDLFLDDLVCTPAHDARHRSMHYDVFVGLP
eukprot:contig_5033_g1106